MDFNEAFLKIKKPEENIDLSILEKFHGSRVKKDDYVLYIDDPLFDTLEKSIGFVGLQCKWCKIGGRVNVLLRRDIEVFRCPICNGYTYVWQQYLPLWDNPDAGMKKSHILELDYAIQNHFVYKDENEIEWWEELDNY